MRLLGLRGDYRQRKLWGGWKGGWKASKVLFLRCRVRFTEYLFDIPFYQFLNLWVINLKFV